MNVIRVALPGYNVLSDTNLDHFSLYSDQDNILIKEFARGTVSLGSGGTINITHNLGYIPFFLVYVNDPSFFSTYYGATNGWGLVGIPVISSNYLTAADTSIVNILNNNGSTLTYKYFIFYDQQV